MRRLLTTALLAAVSCVPTYGVAQAKPSPAVKKILDRTVQDVKKNLEAFQKANKEPLAKAREDLQELAKKLVDAGKEDEAKQVLDQIDTLEDDVMTKAKAPPPLPAQPPQQPLLLRLVGKWKAPQHASTFVVEPNGEMHEDNANGAVVVRGQLRDLGNGTAEAVFANKWGWRVKEAEEGRIVIENFNPEGKVRGYPLILERMP